MKTFLKKFPFFSGSLALFLLILLGGIWCVWERRSAALQSVAKLGELEVSLQQLSTTVPAPTAENAAKIEAAAAKAEASLAEARQNIVGKSATVERLKKLPVPAHRNDAYFDLASFIERLRDRAQRAKVILSDQEMFGFQMYSHTGPEQDLIPAVFQQRLIVQYLAETLLDARPRRLVSFQRERPLTAAVRAARAQAAAGGAPAEPGAAAGAEGAGAATSEGEAEALTPDMFALDPRLSVRKPGLIETQAFRFTFVCQTATLRTVLNKFASNDMPLFVRQLEVVSATEEEARPPEEAATTDAPTTGANNPAAPDQPAANPTPPPTNGAAAAAAQAAAPVPIVPRGFIKATVVVEYVELVSPAAAATPEPTAAPATPAVQEPAITVPSGAATPAAAPAKAEK